METLNNYANKKKSRFFEIYISKVIKKISDSNGITSNAKQQLNSVLCIIVRIISEKAIILTEFAKKKTLSDKEVLNSIRILLNNNLAKNTVSIGQKAVISFEKENNVKGVNKNVKAGILFQPSIVEKFLRRFGYSNIMVTSKAPVCLAGSLEYIATEILKKAVKSAKNNKRIRITIRDLEIGVLEHQDLNTFFIKHNISFLGGGIMPFIHNSLILKKEGKKNCKSPGVDENNIKKNRRFRPGTIALRQIKRFQKTSNCLTFAKFPFAKLVRETIKNNNHSDIIIKVSKDVFIILQYFIEQQAISIIRDSNFAAIHAGRVKMMPIDIEFISSILFGGKKTYEEIEEIEDEE